MKMKLKRKKVIELNHVLNTTQFDLPINGKFRYMLTANIKITNDEIKQLNDAFPPCPEFVEYKQKEAAIYKSFGIESKESINILEEAKKQDLEEQLIALNATYEAAIRDQDVINKERLDFAEEDIEIDLKTVKAEDTPNISEKNQYYHWDIWNTLSLVVTE